MRAWWPLNGHASCLAGRLVSVWQVRGAQRRGVRPVRVVAAARQGLRPAHRPSPGGGCSVEQGMYLYTYIPARRVYTVLVHAQLAQHVHASGLKQVTVQGLQVMLV